MAARYFWLYSSSVQATEVPEVVLTTGSYGVLEKVISASQGSSGAKMANATAILLGTPYNNRTLNMDAFSAERLIIDLKPLIA